ncbi:terminase, partial [Peribacillus sp. NPDC056705]|uniref:terminase n=1 Tax=Peribacillus sp. NPDC056705 TaxID=3345918 RepID=UPI00374A5537
MGRNAKPVSLHIAQGNPNRLTREEMQARANSEIKLGKTELDKLKPPSFVKDDTIAFSYWKQHMKEYKAASAQGVDILTSSDVGTLALYCKTYSEYERLLNAYQRVDRIAENCEPLEQFMVEMDDFLPAAMKQLANLASIDGLLK